MRTLVGLVPLAGACREAALASDRIRSTIEPMAGVRVSENFVPISEFKAQAAEWLRKADASSAPIVVTQNGRPAGVLLSPAAFDALQEKTRFVDAVRAGLEDVEAGRVLTTAALRKRLGLSRAKAKKTKG